MNRHNNSRNLILVDLETGKSHLLSAKACEVARSRGTLSGIDEILDEAADHWEFEYDPLTSREHDVLDLLKERGVVTLQQVRCAGIVSQSIQLQPICESLQRKGYSVEVYRDHKPFLYALETSFEDAVRIAGRAVRMTERQRSEIARFEGWVLKRRKFVESEVYKQMKGKPNEQTVIEDQIKALRRAVPKLREYSFASISNAVDEPEGILGLFGLKREGA